MKGMTTCKVCGRDFPLMAEEHYIAQDPQRIGVLANLANTDKAMEYDAFDCPHCGCQNVMQTRKSIWVPEESEESEEDQEDDTSADDMREYLTRFCRSRWCKDCPLNKEGFVCGRGHSFGSPHDRYGYMSDEEIKKHYDAVKEDN